jgi:hypothetical protein
MLPPAAGSSSSGLPERARDVTLSVRMSSTLTRQARTPRGGAAPSPRAAGSPRRRAGLSLRPFPRPSSPPVAGGSDGVRAARVTLGTNVQSPGLPAGTPRRRGAGNGRCRSAASVPRTGGSGTCVRRMGGYSGPPPTRRATSVHPQPLHVSSTPARRCHSAPGCARPAWAGWGKPGVGQRQAVTGTAPVRVACPRFVRHRS